MLENIVSTFDGISCLQIALNRKGLEYKNYYASEIDSHCIKITQNKIILKRFKKATFVI